MFKKIFSLFLASGILYLVSISNVSAQTVFAPCQLQIDTVGNNNKCLGTSSCFINDQPASDYTAPAGMDSACATIYQETLLCPTFDNGEFYYYSELACTPPDITPSPLPTLPPAEASCLCSSTFNGNCLIESDTCGPGKKAVCSASPALCDWSAGSCRCEDETQVPNNSCICKNDQSGNPVPDINRCQGGFVPVCQGGISCACHEASSLCLDGSGTIEGQSCCQNQCTPPLTCTGLVFSKICRLNCTSNADCPAGKVCDLSNGYCVAGTFAPLVPKFFCDVTGFTARGIDTGLGCVSFCAGPLTSKALAWSGFVNFGIALIILSVAVIMFLTSAGDTKKIQAARELLFSALGGIFLILISVVLLNFLGVNLLDLSRLGFKVSSTCQPITFTPKVTPTTRPTPTPKATPTPTPSPQPTPTPPPPPPTPTPTPIALYTCCLAMEMRETCKKTCASGGNLGPCDLVKNSGKQDGVICPINRCETYGSWCAGQTPPGCIDAGAETGICSP